MSTSLVTPRAAITLSPVANPWCTEVLGISEGPNESRKTAVSSGEAVDPVTGFNHRATELTTSLIADIWSVTLSDHFDR
jgi:hypothetical protein